VTEFARIFKFNNCHCTLIPPCAPTVSSRFERTSSACTLCSCILDIVLGGLTYLFSHLGFKADDISVRSASILTVACPEPTANYQRTSTCQVWKNSMVHESLTVVLISRWKYVYWLLRWQRWCAHGLDRLICRGEL
jgi:hypothetical protein